MVVAMPLVRMMQAPLDQIVYVIAVQYPLVPAIRSVRVARWMRATGAVRCAYVRIPRGYIQFVFVGMISVDVVQMAVMKIVGVSIVPNRRVAARRAVYVAVFFFAYT